MNLPDVGDHLEVDEPDFPMFEDEDEEVFEYPDEPTSELGSSGLVAEEKPVEFLNERFA